MKIIKNSIIPFSGYKYINLFGILFTRTGNAIKKVEYNHESIHTKQMKYMLYIFFYVFYILEWFVKIPICWIYKQMHIVNIKHFSYRSISFEQEAYYNEYNFNYLNKRKPFASFKYLFSLYNPNKKISKQI